MSSSHYGWNGHGNRLLFKPGKCFEALVWQDVMDCVHISWHLSFVLDLPLLSNILIVSPVFVGHQQFGTEFLFLANLSFKPRMFKCWQSKRKIFLSTCPLDQHYIKFGCPKPKSSSCPKSLVRNLKAIRHLMFLISLLPL